MVLKFSRPFRVDYAKSYAHVIVLSMKNIDNFSSVFTPLDESDGYVSKIQIVATPL